MEPSPTTRILVSAVLAVLSLALGCGQTGEVDGPSSSSSSGGHDGGPDRFPCMWGKSDAGLSFPVCPAFATSEFVGTIDGKPYNLKTTGGITTNSFPISPPYSLTSQLAGGGTLDLTWGDPFIRGTWADTEGTITLEDLQTRTVYPDSEVLLSCDDPAWLFILHVSGPVSDGELTGCAR